MHLPRSTIFLFVCGALTSCVDYTPAPLSVETWDRDFAARKLPAQRRPYSISDLIAASQKYQPALANAQAKYATAQAAVISAGGRENPALNLVPGINTSAASDAPSGIPSVSFDFLLETAGKRDLRLLKAQHQALAAGWALQDTAWQLEAAVRNAASNLQVAREREALLQKQVAAQEKILGLAQRQQAAGLLAPAEVRTQDLNLRKARLDLAEAQAASTESLSQLAEAVGVPAQALATAKLALKVNLPSEKALPNSVSRVRQTALTHRPDFAGCLADYASEEANLALEIAKQYPDFKISPGYQWDQGANKWQLGFGANLPLLNQNEGPIAEATAQRREAQTRVEMLQAKISAEVDRAVPALKQAWQSHQAALALVQTQTEKRDASQRRAAIGQAEPMDLLLAEVDLTSAQMILLEKAQKLAQQVMALEALTRPNLGPRVSTPKNSK